MWNDGLFLNTPVGQIFKILIEQDIVQKVGGMN